MDLLFDLIFPQAITHPESLSCISRELVYANCGNICWFFEFLTYITNLAIWLTGSPYYGRCLGYCVHLIIMSLLGFVVGIMIILLLDFIGISRYIKDSKAKTDRDCTFVT